MEHLGEDRKMLESLIKAASFSGDRYLSPTDTAIHSRTIEGLPLKANSVKEYFEAVVVNQDGHEPAKIEFPATIALKKYPLLVSQKDADSVLTSEAIILQFYSTEGYNFTSEFSLIYKARTSPKTAFRDAIAVCKRAIVAVEPALEDSLLELLALYVVSVTVWVTRYSSAVSSRTISTSPASSLPAETVRRAKKAPVKIYIGRSNAHALTFWVRDTFQLQSIAPNLSKGQLDEEKKLMNNLFSVFYESFSLSEDSARAYLDRANQNSNQNYFGSGTHLRYLCCCLFLLIVCWCLLLICTSSVFCNCYWTV